MPKTILIADDATSIRLMVKDYLQEKGYRVVTAENGQTALYVARHEKPDLILLDIMMPQLDGYEFITAYRKEADTPIILLTARLEESDKVLGLELGADDYLTKPFGLGELNARIRAVLRRAGKEAVSGGILRAADITLDPDSRLVTVGQQVIELTPSEFQLLAVLMASPGRVFSRQNLLDQLQGSAWVERTVDVHVRNLRAKIEPDPAQPRYIETVFGAGYRFRPQNNL
jgi:DNA-binding response OmpR family regulator